MKISYDKVCEFVFLVALFCFSISLFNLAGYIFSAIVLVAGCFVGPKFRLTSMDFWLFLFSVVYFVFYFISYDITINSVILYLIAPWSAHILGKFYIQNSTNEKAFITFIVVLSSGMFFHGLLNIVAYLRSDYFELYVHYRQSVDFWRGELVNVKTTEMLYTFLTGISVGVIFSLYKTKYKILATIVIAVSFFLSVFMANRALLIILTIIFLWRMLCWLVDSRVTIKAKISALATVSIILLCLAIMILFNIAGFGDFFLSLRVVQRFTSENELTRMDVWNVFLEDFRFITYPFGGKLLTKNSMFDYLHNMWLDVYNVVGVFPFLILVIVSFKSLFSFLRYSKLASRTEKKDEKIIFETLLLAILLNMMVEPIIEANPYFFIITLMFLGAMEGQKHKMLDESRTFNTVE